MSSCLLSVIAQSERCKLPVLLYEKHMSFALCMGMGEPGSAALKLADSWRKTAIWKRNHMKEHIVQEKATSNVWAKDWKLAFQKKQWRESTEIELKPQFFILKNTFSLVRRFLTQHLLKEEPFCILFFTIEVEHPDHKLLASQWFTFLPVVMAFASISSLLGGLFCLLTFRGIVQWT